MPNEPVAGQVTPKPGEGEKPVVEAPVVEKPVVEKPAEPVLGADGKPVVEKPVEEPAAVVEPVAPEKYELKVPDPGKDEVSPLTDADLVVYSAEAKRLGLTQKQAQTLVDSQAAEITAANKKFLAELSADATLGGDKLEENLTLAKAGRDAALKDLPKEERETILGWLSDPKLKIGNYKGLVRMFVNIGRGQREDDPASFGGQRSTSEKRDPASVLWPDKTT